MAKHILETDIGTISATLCGEDVELAMDNGDAVTSVIVDMDFAIAFAHLLLSLKHETEIAELKAKARRNQPDRRPQEQAAQSSRDAALDVAPRDPTQSER